MKKIILIFMLFANILIADTISFIGSKFNNINTYGISYTAHFVNDINLNINLFNTEDFPYKKCGCKTFYKNFERLEFNVDTHIIPYTYIGSGIGYTSKKIFRQGLYIPLTIKLKFEPFMFHTEVSYNYLCDIKDIRDTKDEIRLMIGVNF